MASSVSLFRRCAAKSLLNKTCLSANIRRIPVVNYAAPKKTALGKASKMGPVMEKKTIPVVTDPEKLANFVCGSNILKEGQDIELKPDSEYPDWLWTIRIGPPPTLDELDPNTLEYWRKLEALHHRRRCQLHKGKKFVPRSLLK